MPPPETKNSIEDCAQAFLHHVETHPERPENHTLLAYVRMNLVYLSEETQRRVRYLLPNARKPA